MRTTTDPTNFHFSFTVTDLARFLGKSPVTLRHWERQGLVVFPRDDNGDRRLTTQQVRIMAQIARRLNRIDEWRLHLVEATVTNLEIIEKTNETAYTTHGQNRPYRSTTRRQNGAQPSASRSAIPT